MNTTQTIVERSTYEAIRIVLIQNGYIADETVGTQAQFEAAMKAIVTTKGFAIDLFGSGSNQSRETKRVPRIVISTDRVSAGELGTDNAPYLVTNPVENLSAGTMSLAPVETVTVHFNIHIVGNTIAQERVMNAIIFQALGTKKYISNYLDSTQSFFIAQTNYYNLIDNEDGIIEKAYVYEARDLFFEDPLVISPVVAINEITTNILIAKTDIPTSPSSGTTQADGNVYVKT